MVKIKTLLCNLKTSPYFPLTTEEDDILAPPTTPEGTSYPSESGRRSFVVPVAAVVEAHTPSSVDSHPESL